MRVAILSRERSTHPGGDLIHIDAVTRELSMMGVERVYFDGCRGGKGLPPGELEGFDLIHQYHINVSWVRECVQSGIRSGLPMVVTCVFYPSGNLGVSWEETKEWLWSMDGVLVYSAKEEKLIRERCGYTGAIDYVYPGVSPTFFGPDDVAGRHGVLTVEAREGAKNTKSVEEACAKLDLFYWKVTGIPHAKLPDIYRKARVYVLPSNPEAWGHTVLESLAAGCRSIITEVSGAVEWLPGLVTVDPASNVATMVSLIKWAYETKQWDYRPNQAARRMTWRKCAEKTLNVYRRVVKGR